VNVNALSEVSILTFCGLCNVHSVLVEPVARTTAILFHRHWGSEFI